MKRGTCKHYNGAFHNKRCEAGILYEDVTPNPGRPGRAFRQPCSVVDTPHGQRVLQLHGAQGTCDKFEEPTEAELAADRAAMDEAVERLKTVAPIVSRVKRDKRGQNWSGVEVCPICGGDLHLRHAAGNGHCHVRCETANCISMME